MPSCKRVEAEDVGRDVVEIRLLLLEQVLPERGANQSCSVLVGMT
jgi:hypothetical protein